MDNNVISLSRPGCAVRMMNVTFRYNSNVAVLDNCSIQINQGEIFALLGPNGCGKTTILKIISGRIKPALGWVRVFGLEPGHKNSNIPGPGIGYMPQEISLFPEFSVEENLKYFAKLFHLSSDRFEERVQYLSELLNLSERNRRISKLSGGQQRLLSIAVTIIHEPKLIILDEPTVGVDPILRCRIWNYLNDLCNKSGTTVIITTHYIEEAKRASNVGFMKSGSIIRQSNPYKLIDEYQCTTLENVFLKLWRQKNDNKGPKIISETDSATYSNPDVCGRPTIYSRNNFSIYRVLALLWKFNLRVTKFPLLAISFIALPLVTLISVYLATGYLPHDIQVAVHSDGLNDIRSKQFIDSISGDFLSVNHYAIKEVAIDSIYKGNNIFAIFFAQNFSDHLESRLLDPGKSSDADDSSIVKLYIDSTNSVALGFSFQYLAQKFQQFIANVSISLGLNPNSYGMPLTIEQPIYGIHPITGEPSDKYRVHYDFIVPAFLISGLHMSALVFSAFVILNNRRGSQMNRYFVCGGTPFEILITHYLSIISFILVQILVLLICGSFLIDIKQLGSYAEVYLICFIQSLQGLSTGALIALIFKEEFNIAVTSAVIMFPMYFMSGMFWPIEGIPPFFRAIAEWTILTKPIDCLRCIMLRGWDYTHPQVMVGYGVGFGYTVLFSAASFLLFQKYQEPPL